MDIQPKDLIQFPIFYEIQEADVAPMLKCLGAHFSSYAKGAYISLAGNLLHNVGLICEGNIHMIREDIWGDKSIIDILSAGNLFGESFACGTLPVVSDISFVATARTQVLYLPFSRVLHSCANSCEFHHRLTRNMVDQIADKNIRLMEKMEILSKKTIRGRILAYLSQQSQAYGQTTFPSPLSRMELAEYLCVDRSALSRELGRMKNERIIDFEKNVFHLLPQEESHCIN